MTISIWRFSHLMLAVISSAFILIASLTGMVLAFEPISNQMKDYEVDGFNEINLATTLQMITQKYDEVLSIEVDHNDFVSASVVTEDGNNESFYINPKTGKKLGDIIQKASIFKFATNLHRSLFLKSTGRFLIGLVSFFLFLIAITGVFLVAKRQGGFQRWFSKVVKENSNQYYHVVIGRYVLVPIVIIALTGVFLSLEKFNVLPSSNSNHFYSEVTDGDISKMPISEFELFKSLKISDIKRVEFPFSEDIEDYFYLKLMDKELVVNQFTGVVISEYHDTVIDFASYWSFVLHTGSGSMFWSIALLLSAIALLFFIYSGFSMTLRRTKHKLNDDNIYLKDEAEYIILVGSETRTTYTFAHQFLKALLAQGKKVFITDLNQYDTYKSAKQLIVFTATYGDGEAPSNASKFSNLLKTTSQNKLEYAVVGFGSLMYPEYCKYAIDIDTLLQEQDNFKPNMPLYKINNKSLASFRFWVSQWSNINAIPLVLESTNSSKNQKNIKSFKVIEKTTINVDSTFLIRLRPQHRLKFESGDIIAIAPSVNEGARLYSVGEQNGDILLAIKRHDKGLCSNYLNHLKPNDFMTAALQKNYDFHFPSYADEVVMIANGTGIAPFLGMIGDNKKQKKIHLFWGGRTKASLDLYEDVIYTAFDKKYLSSVNIAFSQEKESQNYVQDLILQKEDFIANHLKKEGVIMICGSLVMQNGVLDALQEITQSKLNAPLSDFEMNEQIKMDCY